MNQQKDKKSGIPLRLNITFFVIFLLFAVLVIQLGVVQILDGSSYQEEIDRTVQDISKRPVPRGKILDRNGNIVVDNKPLYSITYTPPKRVQAEDKLELAEKLTEYMTMDKKEIDKIRERERKEYFYLKNTDDVFARLSDEEVEKLDDKEQYDLMLERIEDDEIEDFTDEQLQVIAIKRQLDKAYALTPEVIKNENISMDEYAKIAENLSELPGINTSTDWERQYKYKDTLRSIIGSITSQDEGIPAEKEDYYLTRGYNRNDRVGKSGLEEQYEDLLRGRKEKVKYTTTKTGQIIGTEVMVPGERGKDLVLSIDMDFQKKVDEIVLQELKAAKSRGNPYLEDALAVVMNPKTGEILALSGQHYDKETGKYENTPHKVLYDAHRPGSTVKGATVLAGLDSGVFAPGQTIYDSPIVIKGTKPKGSYSVLGSVNDISALKRSSNVYMFYVALRLGGDYRLPFPNGGSPTFNPEGMQIMRNYFQEFGLGVKTGIDFPFESTGYVGPEMLPGKLMDLSIGQYDTYTTLQLGQYISTIANGGKRIQPSFVKEIRSPATTSDGLGAVYKVNHTKILNEISMSKDNIERVQDGFYKVFNEAGGTGHSSWASTKYRAAGKTGTAENEVFLQKDNGDFYKAADTENLSLAGYAPYDDPEIAFAVIIPNLSKSSGNNINHNIGRRILDTYFEGKESENKEEN